MEAGDRPQITFTPLLLAKLKRQYRQAVAENAEQFVFEGHELLTAYAKYLIEYVETRLKDGK